MTTGGTESPETARWFRSPRVHGDVIEDRSVSFAPVEADLQQFAAVMAVVRPTLGDSIVAAYQYGSAVQGGLRPASDLDVFVITDRPLNDEDRTQLITGLSEIFGAGLPSGAARPVEVTVAQLSSLTPWPDSPIREFQFGEWLRSEFGDGYLSPQVVGHDLAPLVMTVLAASEPIIGPDARRLLDPAPRERLVASMRAGVTQLIDELEQDTTNVLLTLCRMLFTQATGEIASKDAAADWVIDSLNLSSSRELLQARALYIGGPTHQTVMTWRQRDW